MRLRIAAVLAALSLIAAGAAGCGDDAEDVVQSIGSDVRAVVAEARERFDDDLARAREEVQEALDAAEQEGVPVAEARRRAEQAIDEAREAADQAIAEAEQRGLDDEADRIREDARREIRELRDRLDEATGGSSSTP